MTPTHEDFAELDPHDFMDKVEAEARERELRDLGHIGPYEWESYDDWQHRRQLELGVLDNGRTRWPTMLGASGGALMLIAGIALTLSYCSKAHADAPPIPQCAAHADMLANLASGYGERRVTDGFVTDNGHLSAIMELTVNRQTGSWTMLLVDPASGRTCIPFSGTNFGNAHPVDAKPEKGT